MLEVIRRRRSNRKFTADRVKDEKVREILTSAMWAPTSRSTRAWEFVVVRDPVMKERLSMATHSSRFVAGASVVIVVCYDNERGFRFREDCSICAEHIHIEATAQGLSSCFVQVCDAGDPAGSAEPYVRGLLGIPDHYRVQCMMPLGYPAGPLAEHTEDEYDPAKVHEEAF
ncbi:MAG: nitroreductase family protein [Thermodesulfobacteriota bacterium]